VFRGAKVNRMAKRSTTPKTQTPEPKTSRPAAARKPTKTATPGAAAQRKNAAAKSRRSPDGAKADRPDLHILMVTPEARPFAKTGGLADVCGALPQALARLGHDVTIVLPRYRGVDISGAQGSAVDVPFGPNRYPVQFVERSIGERVNAVLIDAPDLFDREGLYGDATGTDYRDNAFRFAVLCRGALEWARTSTRPVSVIHAHDWQAGLVPVYSRTVLADDPVGAIPVVFTIHNLAFQGLFDPGELRWIGLDETLNHPQRLEFWGRVSALKGGVLYSRTITTVSPTYAREILTPEFGSGFDGILASRARDLVGILNGIDTDVWNPSTDSHLPAHFDAASLDGKLAVKRALLEAAGLPADEASIARPVIGMVSRLTHQKGFDLIAAAVDRLVPLDASWVMLGSGDREYENFWQAMAQRLPDRVAARIGFDERLAHLIEAGSDLFLMPSRYEPCGLNQMYSLRYGTLPIVHATGGLDDTVQDVEPSPGSGTGFKFDRYTPEALAATVERALALYRDKRRWRTIQRNGMKQDFSWDVSAREYVKVYREAQKDGIRQDSDDHGRELRSDNRRRQTGTR
jgi:starch synthase